MEVLGSESLLDGTGRHQAHVEQYHVVEVLGHGLQVVMNRDDRASLALQLVQ